MGFNLDNAVRAARGLPPQQRTVLKHLAAGLSRKEIADRMVISASTVDMHCDRLFRALGIHNSREAVRVAVGMGRKF